MDERVTNIEKICKNNSKDIGEIKANIIELGSIINSINYRLDNLENKSKSIKIVS